MPLVMDLTDDRSTPVLVMAWCHQTASHYLNQYCHSFLSPYDFTRGWLVKNYSKSIVNALDKWWYCTDKSGKLNFKSTHPKTWCALYYVLHKIQFAKPIFYFAEWVIKFLLTQLKIYWRASVSLTDWALDKSARYHWAKKQLKFLLSLWTISTHPTLAMRYSMQTRSNWPGNRFTIEKVSSLLAI